jgi:hypothetical protein
VDSAQNQGQQHRRGFPYFRALFSFPPYTLLYGGHEDLLYRMEQAFLDSTYPLSLGREDELTLVDEIAMAEAQDGDPHFEGTVLPGDIRQIKGVQVVMKPAVCLKPIRAETLPLRFKVDNRGIRNPEAIKPLSLLPFGTEMMVPTVKALR